MCKKSFFIFIFSIFLIFFVGCSSTSSTNNPPTADFFYNLNSAFDNLSSAAASDPNLPSESFYDDIFNSPGGMLPDYQTTLAIYQYFCQFADYNNSEDRWEATINDPFHSGFITLYGEYECNFFWVHLPGAPVDNGVFYYPEDGSLRIYLPGDPTDPSDYTIKAELYKYNGYYYGFLMMQPGDSSVEFIKFKYEDSNPCTLFEVYYGWYNPTTPLLRQNTDPKFVADIDISEYIYIRFRTENAETWFNDTSDIYITTKITLNNGVLDYWEIL